MLRLGPRLTYCCALVLGLTLELCAEQFVSPAETVLALRNGRVLVGPVLAMGAFYEISFGAQDKVRVPLADVEMWCASLDEAYLRKRDGVRPDDLDGRFALAEWCLRNGLLPRAADQLLVLSALTPQHPRLPTLERRLMSAAITLPLNEPTAAPAVAAEDPPVSSAAAQLPEGAIAHFTQRIQPMLLNRCASNACHGPRSAQQFQLLRPVRGQPMSHRMTQRNLVSTLAFVDQQQPERSQLLVLPRKSHGNQQLPVFNERDALQYEQLAAWARMVTAGESLGNEPPGDLADAGNPALPAEGPPPTNDVAQATYIEFQPATKAAANPSGNATPQRLPAASATATDPLDPEVFNRE